MEIEALTDADYGRVAGWLSDPEINRWLTGRWQNRTFDERHVAVISAAPTTRLFLIRRAEAAIGIIALTEIDPVERSASTWFLMDSAYRSRGLASAALRCTMRLAFQDLGLVSVRAWVTVGNEASRRLMERVGFRQVGRLRRASVLNGRHVDRWVLDLIAEDLEASDPAA